MHDSSSGSAIKPINSVLVLRIHQSEEGSALVRFRKQFTVGRDESCDVVISNGLVSRHHLRFIPKANYWMIEDLDSTNGTYVNGKRVSEFRIAQSGSVTLGTKGPSIAWEIQAPKTPVSETTFEESNGWKNENDGDTVKHEQQTEVVKTMLEEPLPAKNAKGPHLLIGLASIILLAVLFWYFLSF